MPLHWQTSVARDGVPFIYLQPSMPNALFVAGWNSKYKERGADPAGFGADSGMEPSLPSHLSLACLRME